MYHFFWALILMLINSASVFSQSISRTFIRELDTFHLLFNTNTGTFFFSDTLLTNDDSLFHHTYQSLIHSKGEHREENFTTDSWAGGKNFCDCTVFRDTVTQTIHYANHVTIRYREGQFNLKIPVRISVSDSTLVVESSNIQYYKPDPSITPIEADKKPIEAILFDKKYADIQGEIAAYIVKYVSAVVNNYQKYMQFGPSLLAGYKWEPVEGGAKLIKRNNSED